MYQWFLDRVELILYALELLIACLCHRMSMLKDTIKLALQFLLEVSELPCFFFEIVNLSSFQELVAFKVLLLLTDLSFHMKYSLICPFMHFLKFVDPGIQSSYSSVRLRHESLKISEHFFLKFLEFHFKFTII